MDLDLTDEQVMLRDLVRGVCEAYAPLDSVRGLEDDPTGFSAELWKQLRELDLVGLMLPTEHGGSGMGMVEGALLYSELGRALAPTPHFVSAVMSAGAVLGAGTDEQRAAWLPGLASGESVWTIGWLEAGGGYGARGVAAVARPDGDAFRLEGEKWHVPFAAAAEQLAVLARTGDAPTDVDLFVVDGAAPGIRRERQHTIASDTQYRVVLDGARADRLGRVPIGAGWRAWEATLLDGIILLAAQAIGGARRALELAVQYAKDREQFGKSLGAFQAIAHYLADAAAAVDGGETLVFEAAWAHAAGRDTTRLAPMAKLFAAKTFRDVTATAQQIFGGVGFTLEYDIQLYFRRAKQLQLSWWDEPVLEERVAASILDD